jgi:hypothetical protein
MEENEDDVQVKKSHVVLFEVDVVLKNVKNLSTLLSTLRFFSFPYLEYLN